MSLILKSGTYRFKLREWGQTKDHSYKKGFRDVAAACFKQDWQAVDIGPDDCEVWDDDGHAIVPVFGLIDPDTGDGIEKGGGKIGFEFPRPWSDFIAMFKVSNASPGEMGKPVYRDGYIPGMIDMEVKAIPGSGNFAPKNVMVSWRNVERTAKATDLFRAAFGKATDVKPDASNVDVAKVMGK